ncbi:MAG TPA: diphthine--ammonia ligase [Candidatus Binatia bacterium]|nr:diphthine--ammonia ligase [Candidatus Binatia bacterium]
MKREKHAIMNASVANAAVLWTGGKDSALALHEAGRNACRARCLLTFAPSAPEFKAHPVAFMKLQAEALNLPHFLWPVREPFAESYEAGLRWLKETMNIDTVITGDIAEVNGSPNWIRERSRPVGMNVMTPLWGRDRLALLEQMLTAGFTTIFSCVKTRWLTSDWVGRELDGQAVNDLRKLREQNGLDLCGEQGEYHTLVMDAPGFKRRLHLNACRIGEDEDLAYLQIDRAELKEKS